MKVLTFLLSLLGLLAITLACHEGEKKCCSDWFGCQCEGGKWVSKLACLKGSRCAMENGNYVCKRRGLLSRDEDENVIGLPNGPVAVPAIPIDDTNEASDVVGSHPPYAARAEPVPSEIAALIENIPSTAEDTTDAAKVMCGFCINTQGRRSELTGVGVCNTLADNEQYRACSNQYCGLCMIFGGKDCQGNMIHWGGPGEGSYDATGGQSHYCI